MSNALPWNWFDFSQPPKAIQPDVRLTVEEGGWKNVWHMRVDGRDIPFKFFRRAGGTSPRPVLVLLHGMGLTIATFRGVSGYLLATHDLLLIDYSLLTTRHSAGWPWGGVHPKVLADAVWAIADQLHIERISLAGNSLGGGMCLLAALAHRARVDKILLTNPACYPQILPRMYRLARIPIVGELLMLITRPEKLIGGVEYIGYVQKDRFATELRSRYLTNMSTRKNRFRLMELIRHLPADHRDVTPAVHLSRLNEIKMPVLIVWGVKDPLLVAGAGERLARDLPNSTYMEFPDLAHMPHEEAPEIIGPLWAEFLNRSAV